MEDDAPVPDETHLAALAPKFVDAIRLRTAGKVDAAIEAFQQILLVEPRLAEPRMELGRIWLEMGKLDDAEAEAREAIRLLTLGGQWTEELPENVVLGLAWALLAETLKERASSDEVVFGDPQVFRDLLEQSRAAFAQAAALDPTDTASQMNALELGEGVLGGEGEES